MAFGGTLVADDRVDLRAEAGELIARCPPTLKNLIEARGVGILNACAQDQATVCLIVDMDKEETERVPPRREVTLLHCNIPLLHRTDAIHQASAILQWLRAGRSER